MYNDYKNIHVDLQRIELEARTLRAQALVSGIRSLKSWTGKVMHRDAAQSSM